MKEMTLFWLAAMVILFIVEAATVNLVTIWFAFGALAALIISLAHGSLWLQVISFVAVTVITFIPTRALAKKFFSQKTHQPTNADIVIGKPCTVTQDIDNIGGTGAVKCMGKEWTARSESGEEIKSGEVVTAVAIDGVKLIVK